MFSVVAVAIVFFGLNGLVHRGSCYDIAVTVPGEWIDKCNFKLPTSLMLSFSTNIIIKKKKFFTPIVSFPC